MSSGSPMRPSGIVAMSGLMTSSGSASTMSVCVTPHHRARVDDSAATLLDHDARRGLGADEHGVEIEVDDALELLDRVVDERRARAHARVVAQDVETPEGTHDLVKRHRDGIGVIEVGSDRDKTISQRRILLDELGNGSLGRLHTRAGNGDIRAVLEQLAHDGQTDSACPAGHDGVLAFN